jgi:hypothetical protein
MLDIRRFVFFSVILWLVFPVGFFCHPGACCLLLVLVQFMSIREEPREGDHHVSSVRSVLVPIHAHPLG